MLDTIITQADSYKATQWMQYPDGIGNTQSYIESRGGKFKDVVFFGLQASLKKYFTTPITEKDVLYAKVLIDAHIGPGIFNYDGWMYIVEKHGGFLPLKIKALPEGTIVNNKVALLTVESTDPKCGWVTQYIETTLLRDIWYPTTVASLSYYMKGIIRDYLERTGCEKNNLEFMLHDFGARGTSSRETSGIGGLAHLLNFNGTDTMSALIAAVEFYNGSLANPPGVSVIASEHTTMLTNSNSETRDDSQAAEKMVSILEERMSTTDQMQIVSVVSDTYDVYNFVEKFICEERIDRIRESRGRLVIRPDSGDPTVIPIQIVKLIMKKIGYTLNDKGYAVLPDYIRVLQGDGINHESLEQILKNAMAENIAAENFVFGCGGALLQHCDRDWLKFAMKCCAYQVNGEWKEAFKDPITDPGKVSKKGKQMTVWNGHEIETIQKDDFDINVHQDMLRTVFLNGNLLIDETFDEVKNRVRGLF